MKLSFYKWQHIILTETEQGGCPDANNTDI